MILTRILSLYVPSAAMPLCTAHVDPQTNQTNPYYVYPSDGPSIVKISPVLEGFNYHSWARLMCRMLDGKMKLKFMDGTVVVLEDNSDPSFCT